MQIPNINFGINVPRPDLTPYLQARMMSNQALQRTMGQALSSAGESIAGAIQAERQREQAIALEKRFAAGVKAFQDAPIDKKGEAFGLLVAEFPQAKERLKAIYDGMNDDERKAQLDVVVPVRSLLQTGNIDLAKERLQTRLAALQNDPQKNAAGISRVQGLLKSIDAGANGINAAVTDLIAYEGGLRDITDSKWAEQIASLPFAGATAEAKLKQERAKAIYDKAQADTEYKRRFAEIGETNAKAAKLVIEGREIVDRLALDEQKYFDELEMRTLKTKDALEDQNLTGPLRESINADDKDASKMISLASSLENIAEQYVSTQAGGAGTAGAILEWFKRTLGVEDVDSVLKAQYTDLINKSVYANLRGSGSVSNFELQTFKAGWPGVNAKPEAIAAYLNAAAKIARATAEVSGAMSQWKSQNGGLLGNANKDIIIVDDSGNAQVVKKGTPWKVFENGPNGLNAQMSERYFTDKQSETEERLRSQGFIE